MVKGKKRKRLSCRDRAYLTRLFTIFGVMFAIGFLIGRITAPVKTEIVTEIKYIPVMEQSSVLIQECNNVDDSVYYNLPLDVELQNYIVTLCEEENVPKTLIFSMIKKESEFDPTVISTTNDYGLMQINQNNHEWLAEAYDISDFLDPYDNVYCGVKIIGSFLDKYHDIDSALMCYNMGEKGAKSLWERGIHSSAYSREIVGNMSLFEEVTNE